MQSFSIIHITSSPHYPQSNGLAEKYVQIVKCLFNKAKEEGKEFLQVFADFCNTPLTGSLQLPMHILQGRSARSDLPMSSAARNKLGIQPEVLKNLDKHDKLPMHDLHVGQHVMFPRQYKQVMASSNQNTFMPRKVKLYDQKLKLVSSRKTKHISSNIHQKNKMAQPDHKQPMKQPMTQHDQKQPMKQPMAQPEHNKALPENNQLQVTTSSLKGTLRPCWAWFISTACYPKIWVCKRTDLQLTMDYDASHKADSSCC